MKTRFFLYLTLLTSAIVGCSGPKKQTLGPEVENTTKNVVIKASVSLDSIIPNPGVRHKEERIINSSAPPVKLNLVEKMEEKEIKLSDYYSKVKYIKLKHPFAEQGKSFLGNTLSNIRFEEGGNRLGAGINSLVYITPENIIAGDPYFGYHCYDLEGNFIYTIAVMEQFPEYHKERNEIMATVRKSSTMFINKFSVFGDNCLIYTAKGDNLRLDLHSIKAQKTYFSRPCDIGNSMLIDPEVFINYHYNVLATEIEPFMNTYEIQGDTLCRFYNYNSLAKPINSSYNNPEKGTFYYYNDILTFRQSFNDTIFRIIPPNQLTAAYILDFGINKIADVHTALTGDKSGKLMPLDWFETEKFIIIIHTEGFDSQNNRRNKSVRFFYSYYDKLNKKLYRIPNNNAPESFFISNDIIDGIPFLFNNVSINNNTIGTFFKIGEQYQPISFMLNQSLITGSKLYTGYTKTLLEKIIKLNNFSSLPDIQQKKTQAMYEEMEDGELLVMIIE